MPNEEIKEYYKASGTRDIRSDLIYAVENVPEPRIAIDCGCGAGADINYLLSKAFQVYGFDSEMLAIELCQARFKNETKLSLQQETFQSFQYPRSSLVLADASLFFCPQQEFQGVWQRISECLYSGGIFCGSFLGPKDTMANTNSSHELYWTARVVFNEKQARALFKKVFTVLRFTEHESSGHAPDGTPHHWHIFSVVAMKHDCSK